MCLECNGKKEVFRPVEIRKVMIDRPYRTKNGYQYETKEEKIFIGGIDACLVCTEFAESSYQAKILGEIDGKTL